MNTEVPTQDQRVRKQSSKGALEVSRVHEAKYQKEGTLTAEIKQTITTKSYYPSKAVSNNLQDNPFASSEFGFAEQEFVATEKRVAWVDVPKGSTVESVAAKLATLPDATIYKILANKPILSDNQLYAIEAGLTSKDVIADGQVVRFPTGHPQAGQIILDPQGKVQYKATYFKTSAMADQDLRTAEVEDFYATPNMKAELAEIMTSVAAGQDTL
jgi:hypothetical protein